MRISLPPRPAVGGAKTAAPPAATKAPLPGAAPGLKAGDFPAANPGGLPKTAMPVGGKPAIAAPAGVRTVVDTDSAGTALAIAALVASLISFGIVLLSFLQK